MTKKTFLPAFTIATVLVSASSAYALPAWMQEGKSGRWMFNLKLGPAITAKETSYCGNAFGVFDCKPTMGAIVLEMGVAVDSKFNAYIILPVPQFQVHDFLSIVMLPVGFQYDIRVTPKVPDLYITPRLEIGYAAFVPNCNSCDTSSAGFVELAVGGKLIFAKRWNVGFEPFSLAIFFGQYANTNINFTAVSYRLLFYGGVNF
jgi:hypothetical protein